MWAVHDFGFSSFAYTSVASVCLPFEPRSCSRSSLRPSVQFILAWVADFEHMTRPRRLYFDRAFFHLRSVRLPRRQLRHFQMMIHIVIVARWGTKGFQCTVFVFFFNATIGYDYLPLWQRSLGEWQKALTLSLQVVMTWHVACCNQEQVLVPLGGPC